MAFFLAIVLVITSFGIYGITISAATTGTEYSPKYLQNGSFEDLPENVITQIRASGYTQPAKDTIPYWDTTAYGSKGNNGQFEFFGAKTTGAAPPHFEAGIKEVADGDFAAELNADEETTMFQRIGTVSGSTYTWGLDHRGRSRTDRMVLFIGPDQENKPAKPRKDVKNGAVYPDQFVRITDWLKTQYGVDYPNEGCSRKYTVYTRPFAANGRFKGEPTTDIITKKINSSTNKIETNDTNIGDYVSLTQTEECTEEWNLWVISSSNNNTSTEDNKAYKGWSKYGTNRYDENADSYNDVINGAGSKLGYDCTYTVPKGQTETLFAFTSLEGGRASASDATYGNLLDDINFKLYQPISSSITPGGTGGVENGNAIITTDIQNGSSFFETVNDGELCYIHTQKNEGDTYKFQGAYVTVYSNDGKPTTTFVSIYPGSEDDFIGMGPQEKLALAQQYFIPDGTGYKDAEGNQKYWDYVYAVSVESPVHIHMMYTKAPYILYDSNGGETYRWKNDNSAGGNLVGFRDGFKGSEVGEPSEYSDYYKDVEVEEIDNGDGTFSEKIHDGFYKSHAALPNENWNKISLEDGSVVGPKFLGWAITGIDNKQVILDGNHTATYSPDTSGVGNIVFTDASNHNVEGLVLDATRGVTLTAQWQFGYTAQAQTLTGHSWEKQEYINSAVGGTVSEIFIDNRSDVEDHKDAEGRVERTDAYGSVGSKIIFRATPDAANDYVFDGWYKIKDGKYTLITTTPNLAITVEQGNSEAYYARFKTKTVPVVFYYSPTGSKDDYDYYDKDANNKYGKYFQDVVYNEYAIQPTGDSKSVTMWFTSPTERSAETMFDFDTPITKKTELYASPSFTFNYFNYFKGKEPWFVDVYATLKFNGNYIDMKNDADMTNYNIYMLKGTLDETTPTASAIKANSNTKKVSKGNSEIKFNQTTNTGKIFNRAGTKYSDFYIFNMKTPVWVLFDFTYKGITYTSAIKDRSLYNDITVYMQTEKSQLFTTYPESTKTELISAQNKLLLSIQDMYTAVSQYTGIKDPTTYKDGVSASGLPEGETSSTYTFTSKTAIRNIEPWGLKYTFSVDGQTTTDFADYGAVVLTDKSGTYSSAPTINEILKNENSLLYSKSTNNYYIADDGSVEVYHINDLLATDFSKNTYTVFFVKDSSGTYHYSSVVTNSYNELANAETSDEIQKEINQSITKYSQALIDYYNIKNRVGITT